MPIAAAAALALAAPFVGAPAAPPVLVDSYRVVATPRLGPPDTVTVAAPDRFRVRSVDGPTTFLTVGRGGTERIAATPTGDGSVMRNQFAAQPDGFARSGVERYQAMTADVLGQARGGALALAAVTLAGRPTLRADVEMPANDCAGLPARRIRIWLSRRTHLPLRVVERARSTGRIIDATGYAYRLLNAPLPTAVFTPPRVGRRPLRTNDGFIRTSPAAAAGPLPYVPRLPSVLPPGFTLAISGWARRSAITGPEGSIAPFPWLFAATYRRGHERIDITQRVATRDWPDDPFGGECQPLRTEPVTINGIPATYGEGQNTVPHLYWRDGPLLHTLSGPYPKDDLITIAASLAKLGT